MSIAETTRKQFEVLADGSVTAPKGYRASGVAANIKKSGAPDVALIVSGTPATCAALFTTNRVQAAPIQVCKEHLRSHGEQMRAVIINSGNANAVTGQQGIENAQAMADLTASELGTEPGSVLVMSTGVIGVQLPMPDVSRGIRLGTQALKADGGHDAARAIMTTDTRPKELAVSFGGITVAGMCKGAGMIHPNMATMLAVVTTDARIERAALQAMLASAAQQSFNRISVDGDTSTNDTIVLMANGASGISPEPGAFQEALNHVCVGLAKKIVKDGEGATKFVSLSVSGATSEQDAQRVANTIATSMLVKTAIYGRDANWGRVLAAAGRSGVTLDPAKVDLRFGPLQLLRAGTPVPFSEEAALKYLSQDEIEIALDLGLGKASVTMWTCDLSHEYVSINAEYRT
ncbi:MAG: bifunctional glutamate N-acetyltransferase/amino-acid acetyltransferase ArgJ [Chloroflexi bacterium]|nr:MAG: bifunctional glutamate N-acetyltransferase/amino-acid acetyltransferase ArgJ [Chloroflexota bacterium]